MIAVLGAGGQLGTAFVDLLGDAARAVTRSELDLENLGSISDWVSANRPEVVINCAAYTGVDAAESEEELAGRVNALAVGELASACAAEGSRFVTFSTDYIFDGTKDGPYVESDRPNPLSVYGRTKAEGERLGLEANPHTLVVRSSWVVSGTHPNFVATMLDLIRKGTVDVVDDQRGHPTVAADLAPAVMDAVDSEVTGILHLANDGVTTWCGLATDTARLAGLDPNRVRPISSEQFSRPAPRPRNSVLESERRDQLGIGSLPHYLESLPAVVESLIARGY